MRLHRVGLEEIVRDKSRKWVTFLHTSSVPLGHDGGDHAADTRRRDESSSPSDGGDRRLSFFYFYGFGFVFWESNRAEGVKGK